MEALGLGMVGGGTFFTAEDTESTEGTGVLQQKARTERRGACPSGVADVAGVGVKIGCGRVFPQGRRGAEGDFLQQREQRERRGALVWASLSLLAWV